VLDALGDGGSTSPRSRKRALDLTLADRLGVLAQLREQRLDLELPVPATEALDLLLDDRSTFGTSRRRAAIASSSPTRRSSTSKSRTPSTSPAARSTSAGNARSTTTSGRSARPRIAAATTPAVTTGASEAVA
jgi:hypothetical protein